MTYSAGSGFTTGTVNGGQPSVLVASNIDLSGRTPQGQPGNCFSADGHLMIGRALPNAFGTNTEMGFLTCLDGSTIIENGPGTINLKRGTGNFSPNAVLQEFDDFISSYTGGSSNQSKIHWTVNAASVGQLNGVAGHPGIWNISPSAGSSMGMYIAQGIPGGGSVINGPIILGSGSVSQTWIIKLSALSSGGNTYRFSAGLCDGLTVDGNTDAFVNGVYFQYTDSVNGGQWTIKTTSSSVTTTVNTAIAAVADWVTLTILVNANASSVSYYINNALIGTAITTNIPTTSLSPMLEMVNTAGNCPPFYVDLYWIQQVLTNPRPGPSPVSGIDGIVVLNYRQTAIDTTITSTDAIVGVTDTSIPHTMTMTATPAFVGQEWTISDETAGAGTNAITIDGNGHNIVGVTSAPTYIINSNGGSVTLYWNGTIFKVI